MAAALNTRPLQGYRRFLTLSDRSVQRSLARNVLVLAKNRPSRCFSVHSPSSRHRRHHSTASQSPGENPSLPPLNLHFDIKHRILKSAIPLIPTYGWTVECLTEASASQTVSPGLVSPADLVAYCMDEWTLQWKQELQQRQSCSESSNKLGKLQEAIWTRLQFPHRQHDDVQWHEAVAIGARAHPIRTMSQIRDIAETALMHTGYSPDEVSELSLGAIYTTTELHLLSSSSPRDDDEGLALTKEFLGQQLRLWEIHVSQGGLAALPPLSVVLGPSVAYAAVTGLASAVLPPSMDHLFVKDNTEDNPHLNTNHSNTRS